MFRFTSTDTDSLNYIETTLPKLMRRLDVQQEPIDQFLKSEIIYTIMSYSQKINRKSNKNLQAQSEKLSKMIHEAKLKAENLTSIETFLEEDLKNKKKEEISQMKNNLNAISKDIKKETIHLNDCIYWIQCIEHFEPSKKHDYSNILVELFVHTSPKTIYNSLNEFLWNLKNIFNYISALNFTTVQNLMEKNAIANILQYIQSIINGISKNTAEALDKLKENPETTLKRINEEISSQENNLYKAHFPMSSATIEENTKQLCFLKNHLTEISSQNSKIEEEKRNQIFKINCILETLCQLNEKYEFLVTTEKQSFETIRSYINFENKLKNLKSMLHRVQDFKIHNQVLQNKQEKLILTISTLIASENLNYLKEKLEIADNFKSYAQGFSFPIRNKMYNIKRKEMLNLMDSFKCIPEDNLYQKKILIIGDRIQEALTILEVKAIKNEETLEKLRKLQNIQMKINNSKSINLQDCNTIRNEIQNIEEFTNRLINKKIELLQTVHQYELKFHETHFPQFLSIMSKLLDKYQLFTQKYMYCDDMDIDYKLEKEELRNYQKNVQSVFSDSYVPDGNHFIIYFQDFLNTIKSALKKIEKLLVAFTTIKEIESKLNLEPTSEEEDNESKLQNLLDQLQSLEEISTRNDFKLKLQNVKRKIRIEQLKREIRYYYNLKIKTFSKDKEHVSIKKIYELLNIKEEIEQMLEGYSELDADKESALKNLKEILKNIDPNLPDLVFSHRGMQTINVEAYFTNVENIPIEDKESTEYVQYIYQQAKFLEDDVEMFLGSKDSTDFYIVDEKLMRLLEKLDSIKSKDDKLTDQIIETMLYIKKLKKKLSFNTSLK